MTRFILRIALLVLATSAIAWSQKPSTPCHLDLEQMPVQTFHLKYVMLQSDQNEILTALRNVSDPQSTRFFLVPSQNVILLRACPEDIEKAKKIVQDLDQPAISYRLTYTLTEVNAGKRGASQTFVVDATAGQRSQLKHGIRVPITTGSFSTEKGAQTQNQYMDVGISLDAAPIPVGDGISLRISVERSSLSNERSTASASPVIAQSSLQSTVHITEGKSIRIGTIALPESNGTLEIELSYTPLK